MRLASLCTALVVALVACKRDERPPSPAPESPAKPGPVTFGAEPLVPGERFVDSVATSMRSLSGEPLHTASRVATRLEVMATDGGTIDAVRVMYADEGSFDYLLDAGARGPMLGRAFIARLTDGELEVLEVGGAEPMANKEDRGRVLSDVPWLGKPNAWRAAVAGQTFQPRQPSAAVARALADHMTVGWTESTATASALYASSDGGVARFEVTVDQTMNASQPRRMQSKLNGVLDLRVRTGDFALLELEGAYQFWEGNDMVGETTMRVQARRKTADDLKDAPPTKK